MDPSFLAKTSMVGTCTFHDYGGTLDQSCPKFEAERQSVISLLSFTSNNQPLSSFFSRSRSERAEKMGWNQRSRWDVLSDARRSFLQCAKLCGHVKNTSNFRRALPINLPPDQACDIGSPADESSRSPEEVLFHDEMEGEAGGVAQLSLSYGRENLAEYVAGSLRIMTFGIEHVLEMILRQLERFGWELCVLRGILSS